MTQLLKSTQLSYAIRMNLKDKIQGYHKQGRRPPKLVMILISEDFASHVYVKNKEKACAEVGMLSEVLKLPIDYSQSALINLIHTLNANDTVDGILVQLPLPPSINVSTILDLIDPLKDVDGFHPINMGLLAQGRPQFRACTPYGIIRLLEHFAVTLKGMHAVIVGASNIVGKPMMLELLNAGCTVTICHIATKDLAFHIKAADLLVSAIGKRDIIKSHWIKAGSIVIDAGINHSAHGITGDIECEEVINQVSAITPVPQGVGPMTVAMLLENTCKSYDLRIHKAKDDAFTNTTD